jgi:hypothetical protein
MVSKVQELSQIDQQLAEERDLVVENDHPFKILLDALKPAVVWGLVARQQYLEECIRRGHGF